ncbi:Serine/threonine-protein kinase RIO3 [Nymphon striatum]|nr:Serine/threonine-protein kinase RIO3 [Nymphon striatum]
MEVTGAVIHTDNILPPIKESEQNPPKVSLNPWGKVTGNNASCPSFSEVLSEELAKSIHLEEQKACYNIRLKLQLFESLLCSAGSASLSLPWLEDSLESCCLFFRGPVGMDPGRLYNIPEFFHWRNTGRASNFTGGTPSADMWIRNPESNIQDISLGTAGEDLCNNDYVLAQVLQANFDKENDFNVQKEEKKLNGNSKVSLSYINYLKKPVESESDDDDDEYDSFNDHGMNISACDSFEKREKQSPTVGKTGIIKHANGSITTKHDPDICGRRNATKVMQFAPGIETGDGGGFDMVLPNRVFNTLKVHSQAENRRHQRHHDKKEKFTAEQSIDEDTLLIIHKLVNTDILKSVSGIISTGKEACIFHGFGGQIDGRQVPNECALKVYKTTLNEFVSRDKYIANDFRFKDRFSKHKPKAFINLWAEKEMHNLKRLHSAGIPCPEVVVLKKNVLLMSFIGSDCKCACKLKDTKMPSDNWIDLYHEVVNIMKIMYNKCKLIHADLSEYNILWYKNKLWIIDVGQAVEPTHPHALEFLLRDCANICRFFKKKGVSCQKPKELFMEITQKNFPGEGVELLSAIQNYEKNEEMIRFGASQTSEAFDYIFENISKSPVQDTLTESK